MPLCVMGVWHLVDHVGSMSWTQAVLRRIGVFSCCPPILSWGKGLLDACATCGGPPQQHRLLWESSWATYPDIFDSCCERDRALKKVLGIWVLGFCWPSRGHGRFDQCFISMWLKTMLHTLSCCGVHVATCFVDCMLLDTSTMFRPQNVHCTHTGSAALSPHISWHLLFCCYARSSCAVRQRGLSEFHCGRLLVGGFPWCILFRSVGLGVYRIRVCRLCAAGHCQGVSVLAGAVRQRGLGALGGQSFILPCCSCTLCLW
jgi:hypothetical protein